VEASRKRWTATRGSGDVGRPGRNGLLAADLPQPATVGSTPRVDGKEGVAGSSPAEGFGNRARARCSFYWSGSGDHFQAQGRGRRFESRRGSPAQGCCGAPLAGARSVRIVGSSLSRVPSGHRPIRGRPILPSGSRRRQRRTPRTAARRRPSSTELGPDLSRERDGSAQADPSVWRRAARRYKSCLPRLSERPAFAGLLRSSTDSRRRRRRRRGVRGARPHRAI
jgi:hypothetical protein